MVLILKTLGVGILTVLLSPFIALVLALYFVYTLLGFIAMFFINIVKFFQGKSILDPLDIDKKAKNILEARAQYDQRYKDAVINSAPNNNNYQNAYPNTYQNNYQVPSENPIEQNNPSGGEFNNDNAN